ncbi:NADP-dependent oxidoreductase domain-containing protein [Halteromyces radiatus]|uniref:NADP-dependent oxidoreductase domain-containing protein n=1 Tax=Halteromyces radiatus TaxID=101107 RepID=UPI00221FC468|nr:NADP-dependent oxidoreductase domain-containing protein [Halteromyces radiatus]KAI8099144.1 NADP-dependent oxidoreductase domain-containing protein [Halteromyces radiatus]
MTQMQYVRFGNTGLRVSRISLGCMSYGSSQWQDWVKDEEASLDLIEKAYKQGINFFDTANGYSNGESERILGKAIKKFKFPRGRIVVATKVFFPVSDDISNNVLGANVENDAHFVNGYGLSRKHIFDAVDASLKRLDLDYIDLLYIHRYDKNTPIEETMEALNDIVKSGKVRYIAASSMNAWKFIQANHVAELKGWTKFVGMQNLYNLIYREEEREMIPFLENQGIAMIPWSPLARGLLCRPENESSIRFNTDRAINGFFSQKESANNSEIILRVKRLADEKGVSMSQIALAWVLSKPFVTSPIVGIGKEEHLYDLVKALDINLTQEEINMLEEPYIPRNLIPM